MKIHLVTYGDTKFKKIKEDFLSGAEASGFFDCIHSFSDNDIDTVFFNKIYSRFKACRGGGYWIWKPYFVRHVMQMIDDNDILIYCDAGCIINNKGGKRFEQYVNMVKESFLGALGFSLQWSEIQYTKKEVFNFFNASESIINSPQIMATVLVFRKCVHSNLLVNKWYKVAWENPLLFTDEINLSQYAEFIDHRHDQSIFSLIRKIYGSEIVPNETAFYKFDGIARLFPFWATQTKP